VLVQAGLLHRQGTAMLHRAKPVCRSCCSAAETASSVLVVSVAAGCVNASLLLGGEA
jgi:hypothetical protein